MTKKEREIAAATALMEITQIVKEVKALSKEETEALQIKLCRWLKSADAELGGE